MTERIADGATGRPGEAAARSGRRQRAATRAVFLLTGIALSAWAPLVPFAKTRLGIDDAVLGLLLLCVGGGSLLAMPLSGALATRLGCRRVLIAAGCAIAAILPLLILADSLPLLAVSLALFGAGIGALDVVINIQAVIVEQDSRHPLMSGFHGLFSLGGILGAGSVSALLGLGLPPLGAVLTIGLAVLLLLAAAAGGLLPRVRSRKEEENARFVWPRGPILVLGALCFCLFLAEGSILDWGALLLISHHGVDPSQAGYGYALFAAAMTAGRLTGDRAVRRLGASMIVGGGGLLCLAGFALLALAPDAALALPGFVLIGIGAANIVPVLFTAAGRQETMPTGLAISTVSVIGYTGFLTGPALIGLIGDRWGLDAAFLGLAAAMAAVGSCGGTVRPRPAGHPGLRH